MITNLLVLICQAMPVTWFIAVLNKGKWPMMDSFASDGDVIWIVFSILVIHLLADCARHIREWLGHRMIAVLWHTGPIEGVRFDVAKDLQPDEEWVALIARSGKRYNFAPYDAENMRVIEVPA
jgi:hypothetical protein